MFTPHVNFYEAVSQAFCDENLISMERSLGDYENLILFSMEVVE